MYSEHPYEEFIPDGATRLIIGTIPPYRFCVKPFVPLDGDVNFYYGSKDNAFWRILGEITGETLGFANTEEAVKQRKRLLDKLNVGITDIVAKCVHDKGNASDACLKEIEQKPLEALLSGHPGIDTLIYTSGAFMISQINKKADRHYHIWEVPKKKGFVTINGKQYNVIVLYSPSRLALRSVKAETRLQQYKEVFGARK